MNVKLPKRVDTDALRKLLGQKKTDEILAAIYGERALRKPGPVGHPIKPEQIRAAIALVSGEARQTYRQPRESSPNWLSVTPVMRTWLDTSPRSRLAFLRWARRELAELEKQPPREIKRRGPRGPYKNRSTSDEQQQQAAS